MNEKLEVALTALADALAELPTKDIVFELLNGGRLVDEVALMLEDRHPAKSSRDERRISGLEGPRSALAQAVRVELNLLLVSWQLIGSYK